MKQLSKAILSAPALFGLVGCGSMSVVFDGPAVTGSGVTKSETRQVKPFTKLDASGIADVRVTFGPQTSVQVQTDDNILPLVQTESDGETLHIGNGHVNNIMKLIVVITTPHLSGIELSGATKGSLENVSESNLSISVDGAGTLTASGAVDNLNVSASGAARVQLQDLKAHKASVDANGAGSAKVWVESDLNASASGAGSVRFKGSPSVHSDVSGAGSIRGL